MIVSVQLFSNADLAHMLCVEDKLLYIIIVSLKFAIEGNRKNYWGILVPNTLLNPDDEKLEIEYNSNGEMNETTTDANETVPRVVSCDHPILVSSLTKKMAKSILQL